MNDRKVSHVELILDHAHRAWIEVPPEHHPIFREALPVDRRVETAPMFGGIVARANGQIFAGLFGRSTMIWLPEAQRGEALALEGAMPFDPMGDRRARSDKVMLPEAMMAEPAELRRWVARAFEAVLLLPRKTKAADKRTKKPGNAARPSSAPEVSQRSLAPPRRRKRKP